MAAISTIPANAQNDRVERAPPPDWVTPSELMEVPENLSGLVFVRRQDTLVHLDETGQAQYSGYRIKILHPNALQLGNLTIAWNPASGPPTVHAIKVYRDGDVIDILENASFEIIRREDQLETAKLDGVLTAVLRISDLRVGDELEFAMTVRIDDPTLGSSDAGVLYLPPDPAPGRFRLGLSWIDGQKPDVLMTPDMAAASEEGARAMTFDFDNPPIAIPPKDAPPRYQFTRIIEYSDFADWNAISRRFFALFSEASEIPESSPLMREVTRIKGAYSSQLERANAALKLVQQDVRYIYVGLDGGNYRPVSAAETWSLRYGDCKGKTALLLGLLNELGIQAEAVLANNSGGDDGLDERLPNPHMFDHVLVRARIDGKRYYLDGTLPPVAHSSLIPLLPYRWVLPLSDKGSTIEHLAWKPASAPNAINLYEIDARNGFNEPATITSTTITRGLAGLAQQIQFSALTHDQLISAFRQNATGDTWQAIEDVQWHFDQDAGASVLAITGTGTVDWDVERDGGRSLALPGGGFSPPQRRVRAAEQDQAPPYYNEPEFSCHVTTVRLPENTRVEQWSHKAGYNQGLFGQNYYRAFDIRFGTIRMVRAFRVEELEISAERASRDNARIASFDNSMAWIFYEPDDENESDPDSAEVPATYERDWVADYSACLSPDAA